MLKKLLKYDLKTVYKVMTIFIILSISFAILTRIFFAIDDNSFILRVFSQIWQGTAISMMVSLLINGLMRCWVRFNSNIYGDESYLTHTLPVTPKEIYVSKFITAVITILVTVITILICLFIMYYSSSNLEVLKNSLKSIALITNSNVITLILVFAFVYLLEMLSLILAGYTGLLLGHRFNNSKMLKSVFIGLFIYVIMQVINLLIIYLVALFNPSLMNLFTSSSIANISILKTLIFVIIIVYAIYTVLYYFIDIRILNKGVNVD